MKIKSLTLTILILFVLSGLLGVVVAFNSESGEPVCGDGFIDASQGEQCDGSNLNGLTCSTLLGQSYTGSLSCQPNCIYNALGCILTGGGVGGGGGGGGVARDVTPPITTVKHFTNRNELSNERECVLEDREKKAYLNYDDVVGHGISEDKMSNIEIVLTTLDDTASESAVCEDDNTISCKDSSSELWHTRTYFNLDENWHELSARAQDAEGNSGAEDTCKFCIDTQAPAKPTTPALVRESFCDPNYINNEEEDLVFSWRATHEGCAGISFFDIFVEIDFDRDGIVDSRKTLETETASINLDEQILLGNRNAVRIRVVAHDKAGNEGEVSDWSNWIIVDNMDPIVTITNTNEDEWVMGDLEITEIDDDENLYKCFYKVQSGFIKEGGEVTVDWTETLCNQPFTLNTTQVCIRDGKNQCIVFKMAQDKACNEKTRSKQFDTDNNAPGIIKEIGTPHHTGFRNMIEFSFSGLEPLSRGHYEGWAIYSDEEKVSTGKFNLDGDTLKFSIDRDLSELVKIAVTIEPEGDNDEIPSGIVVLVGDVEDNLVSLSFPVNLSSVEGNYILATPTDGNNDEDETSGVWFLELTDEGPLAGLTLPVLPAGWKYEGWAVNQGSPLSTGKFSSPEGTDEFNGFSGPISAPPFPGEDFLFNAPQGITFPINLADGLSKIVISIEPDLEGVDPTGEGPFSIKPLIADVLGNAEPHANYEMNRNLASLPSGIAVITEMSVSFVTTETIFEITATDQGSGVAEICYQINTNEPICFNEDNGVVSEITKDGRIVRLQTEEFNFQEESLHTLTFWATDNKNQTSERMTQTHFVDETAPTTTKTYSNLFQIIDEWIIGDLIIENFVFDWIGANTQITLQAQDNLPHPSGLDATLFRIFVLSDEDESHEEWYGLNDRKWYETEELCEDNNEIEDEEEMNNITDGNNQTEEDEEVCILVSGWNNITNGWQTYESPITLEEREGPHKICFFSTDNVENQEAQQCQVFFVDSEAPTIHIAKPTLQEASNIRQCTQTIVAIVSDDETGVKRVWAELTDSNGTIVRTEEMRVTIYSNSTRTYETTMDKQLQAGTYTLTVYAEDNVNNRNSESMREIINNGILVEFINPAVCSIDPATGGNCDFTFNICMRGGDSIKMWMDELGNIATPGMMNAAISKGANRARVGLLGDEGPLVDGELLTLSEEVINRRTTFDLHLNLDANITSAIGTGSHALDYLITAFAQ